MEVIRCYEVKLKPNKTQFRQLNQYLYEAKLLYNYLLNQEVPIFQLKSVCKMKDIWKFDEEKNQVGVKLEILPAKLKQNVHRQIMSSIKALAELKKKGKKVGKLKNKERVWTLNLDNQSWKVRDHNHVSILGFGRQKIKCCGLRQLEDKSIKRLRDVKLTKKKDGNFYLLISVKKEIFPLPKKNQDVGLDLGIESTVTTSDREKWNCKISETKKLKNLQRKIARSKRLNNKKRTRNQFKLRIKLRKQYQRISNLKKEFVHQKMHYLNFQYDHVVFQDESIRGWRNLKGNKKTIQHSCLGDFKQNLIWRSIENSSKFIMLDKWVPTTQYCRCCGKKNKHELQERTYHCSCGYTEDRDVHAAKNMLHFAGLTA